MLVQRPSMMIGCDGGRLGDQATVLIRTILLWLHLDHNILAAWNCGNIDQDKWSDNAVSGDVVLG